MKRLGVLAAASLLSVGAMAADNTISATARMGYIGRNYDVATTRNSSAIEAEFFRISFNGVLNASTKYHFVLDPVVANAASDTTTNISSFINEIWIDRSIGDATNVIVGKQKILVGSMEYWYSTPDVYTYSQFNGGVPSRTAAATLSHKVMGQEFKLQLSNGNEDKRISGTKSQSKFGYGVLYKGSAMDGMIKPMIGYTVDPTERAGGADSYLAGGAQLNAAGFTVEAEYDLKTQKKFSAAYGDNTTNSLVALARHNGENFQPFVKYIADWSKTPAGPHASTVATATPEEIDRTSFDIGLEMKESKEDAIRYHIVYSAQSVKNIAYVRAADATSVAASKNSPSQIYAGVKFTADILK